MVICVVLVVPTVLTEKVIAAKKEDRMKNRNIRYQVAIDQNAAAMKLIEILLAKGMINQATYTNIVKHSNLHISQVA